MLRNKTLLLLVGFSLSACGGASPEDVEMSASLALQGKTLLVSSKYGEASDMYQSAIARDEDNAKAWNGLGVSYDMLGKKEPARQAYDRAHELNPADAVFANNLAHAYLEKGDAETALKLMQPFITRADAPTALRANYEVAEKAAKSAASITNDVYADLGSFPTPGMAQGRINQAQKSLGSDTKNLTFTTETEVKVGGGTPVFTVKVTGASPQSLCEDLMSEAIPCIPHGK